MLGLGSDEEDARARRGGGGGAFAKATGSLGLFFSRLRPRYHRSEEVVGGVSEGVKEEEASGGQQVSLASLEHALTSPFRLRGLSRTQPYLKH